MNKLTFDIEECIILIFIPPKDKWLSYPPRIDLYLSKISDLLDEKGIKSTFLFGVDRTDISRGAKTTP